MRILLHVYQKNFYFFDIVYFSRKTPIRQVLADHLEEIPVFCKSWYLIKNQNIRDFPALCKLGRLHIKISEINHIYLLKMIDDKGRKGMCIGVLNYQKSFTLCLHPCHIIYDFC